MSLAHRNGAAFEPAQRCLSVTAGCIVLIAHTVLKQSHAVWSHASGCARTCQRRFDALGNFAARVAFNDHVE